MIIVILMVTTFLILSLPVLGITYIIDKISPGSAALFELRFVQYGFRIVNFLSGHKVDIIGLENIPDDKAVLFVGNHRGFFDVITSYAYMPGLTGYVAKKSFRKVPILGFIMQRINCLFMDRSDPKQSMKVIMNATDNIKKGISMFIYPEGTRNHDPVEWNLLPMHRGSFKPAQRAKCPIIPVAVSHSDQALENCFPRIKPTHLIVRFGRPFCYSDLSEEDRKNIEEYTAGILVNMLKQNEGIQ